MLFGDRAGEQQGLLEDDAELAPHVGELQVAHVVAVDPDAALLGVVEARQQADERRLARARRPDDRHGASGGDPERDVLQHVGPAFVAEPDAVELDLAAGPLKRHGRSASA